MVLSTNPYALVVDDDAIIRIDAAQILQDAGFRTYEAGDGDEAKLVLEEFGANVILLFSDVEMPGSTDGFALARYAAEKWPELEIVVASGRRKPEAGEMPDCATFISKPFDDHVVHSHLRKKLPDGKKPEPLKRAV
ncbi:response regulator [Brevundimonas sp. PAMC22021]|uniref:response regulator n=1 Tax=Brevundimonas sp. PAMC22021 TaxID=2861285 RepID=UPI001C637797|nr:response regulator [Brevundimonas sp. PAMC22021]QYF87029.1 response regulator [Brevundimonas sp. PAMC22021]